MRVGMDARLVGRGLGIATFVAELGEALRRRKDVELVWLGEGRTSPEQTPFAEAPARWPFPLLDLGPGKILARQLGLDVIHFAANTGWPRGGPVPSVLTVHDLIYFEPSAERSIRQRAGHAYLRFMVPRAAMSAAALAAISTTTADAVSERLGRRPTVIPHGIRLPDVDSSAADAGAPYLVAFGSRDPRKGTELALEVFRRSRSVVSRLELVARGGLPPGFEGLAAPELGDGSVVVHEGLPRPDLERLLAGAFALIYLSRSEGFGLPVLEAMACGIPVITGLAPATRETGGNAALYVDELDPVASAVALTASLAHDAALRARTIDSGRRLAIGRSWAQVASRYVSLYQEVAR